MIPPEIVTVTLNPAIDQTLHFDHFTMGEVNRVVHHHRQAGGKGVNVSAMLAAFGIGSTATGFMGRGNSSLFTELFESERIDDRFIRLPGETRTGIKLICVEEGMTTDINFPGITAGSVEIAALEQELRRLARPGAWFVFGGSLPPGVAVETFVSLLEIPRAAGALVALDTSGPALRAAVEGGVDLIKPNEHELAEALGMSAPQLLEDPVRVLRSQKINVPGVILTMGAKGAIFADGGEMVSAAPLPVEVAGTVGAGDAVLAGYLAGLAMGQCLEDRARLATVFAAAILSDVRRKLPDREELLRRMPQVEIRRLS